MKSLLIVPSMPYYAPYIQTYTDLMDQVGEEYDVICWNRKGDNVNLPDNYIVYAAPTNDDYPLWRKIYENFKFYRFVKPLLKKQRYQCIFVFTIVTGLFLKNILIRKYKDKYIFDIRDYSPAMRSSLVVIRLKILLRNSYKNVISSDGFKEWLPQSEEYLTTHNVRLVDVLKYNEDYMPSEKSDELSVLNIGAIRDVSSNTDVIKKLGNKKAIKLMFVGDGLAVPALKQYAEQNNINNVYFYGRYDKREEVYWVQKTDTINSYLTHTMVGDSLMSNRFYLSVMFRKPLVVNDGCYQAKIVERFGLGVIINSQDDMYMKIMKYWQNIDWVEYNLHCRKFIEMVVEDLKCHERNVKLFLQNNM